MKTKETQLQHLFFVNSSNSKSPITLILIESEKEIGRNNSIDTYYKFVIIWLIVVFAPLSNVAQKALFFSDNV